MEERKIEAVLGGGVVAVRDKVEVVPVIGLVDAERIAEEEVGPTAMWERDAEVGAADPVRRFGAVVRERRVALRIESRPRVVSASHRGSPQYHVLRFHARR